MSHDFDVGKRCSRAFGDRLVEETYSWFADEQPELHTWLVTFMEKWEIVPVRDETVFDYDTGMAYFHVYLRLYEQNDVVLFKLRWR